MNSIRFQDGIDCWTCSGSSVNLSGRICRCGKTYADILIARHAEAAKTSHNVSHNHKRQPAKRGQFTESYCFKKEQKMDEKDKKIQELEQSLARRARWFDRLQTQFRDLTLEANDMREQIAALTKERDTLLGDVTKLKALVDELSAKRPETSSIIIP